MIPKIIHYCWFGRGEMSALMKKCVNSWKKYCPDYQVMLWNEDNFNIDSVPFVKQAYENKKYAFVSDYVRLYALYNYGGVYLDTDQELIKNIDCFLDCEAFIGHMYEDVLSTGVIGSQKQGRFVSEFLNYYKDRDFIQNGQMDLTPNTDITVQILKNMGIKATGGRDNFEALHIYPSVVFTPYGVYEYKHYSKTETYAIHHWSMSWRSDEEIKKAKKRRFHLSKPYRFYEKYIKYLPQKTARKIFGNNFIDKLKDKCQK